MLTMTEILDFSERVRIGVRVGESQYREFKSTWEGRPGAKIARPIKEVMVDIARTLVAFANADGGELFVGVEDDNSISGCPYNEEQIGGLLQATRSHVHSDTPLPTPKQAVVSIDDKKVLYFAVSKGVDYVYLTVDGRCLKRIDRDSVPYSPDTIIVQRLEDRSRSWDRNTAHGATLQDLDVDLINTVASQIAYGISAEKCLQYLDLAEFTPDGLKLKNAAVVLFAKDVRRWHPRCQVRIMTVDGTERLTGHQFNVVKDDQVADNILKLVDVSWERLTLALSKHTQLTATARFQQSFLYPQIACREALINAIVHRNYSIEGRGIEIAIFHDRLEIASPGMLLTTVSIEDLRAARGAHESRNPLVARVLREVGLVREMGEGMRRIYEVMRSSALTAPVIENPTTGFSVTLFHKSLYEPQVRLWLDNFDSYDLTENQRAVLALGYGGVVFSPQDVFDRLGIIDTDQSRAIITPLRSSGLLERILSDGQISTEVRKKKIPKRSVKIYRVALPHANTEIIGNSFANDDDIIVSPDYKLFLTNLPFESSENEILEYLSTHCEVVEIFIPKGRDGRENRGFAFITVHSSKAIQELLKTIDGKQFGGRVVHAQVDHKSLVN